MAAMRLHIQKPELLNYGSIAARPLAHSLLQSLAYSSAQSTQAVLHITGNE